MERRLTYLLRQATMAMRAAFRHSLEELELTPPQNTVLHLLAEAPGTSSAELARRMYVSAQTMHKRVAELERRELLVLQPRPGHGRILGAHLTDRGQELLARAEALGQALEDRMTAGLDERQRRQLLDLLQHCITALGTPPGDVQGAQNRVPRPSIATDS